MNDSPLGKTIVVIDGYRYEFNHLKRGTYLIALLGPVV